MIFVLVKWVVWVVMDDDVVGGEMGDISGGARG